jgi:F420-dependent oxidoreductase-like protein
MEGGDRSPGSSDAWITLAGLARETERIRLGVLVSSATFRLPGVLAVMAAQVDQMSGGRLELGLGAGWFMPEHTAYGIPFPESRRERVERWDEQLAIVTGIWSTMDSQPYSFSGKYYTLVDCPGFPKPMQRPHPPIIVGGSGQHRTPMLAARYANEFNVPFRPIGHLQESYNALDRACERIGREPESVRRSCARTLCCGETNREIARRSTRIGRGSEYLSRAGIVGTPEMALDALGKYAAIGVTRVYLQTIDLRDMDHLRLVAEQVLPHARDL